MQTRARKRQVVNGEFSTERTFSLAIDEVYSCSGGLWGSFFER